MSTCNSRSVQCKREIYRPSNPVQRASHVACAKPQWGLPIPFLRPVPITSSREATKTVPTAKRSRTWRFFLGIVELSSDFQVGALDFPGRCAMAIVARERPRVLLAAGAEYQSGLQSLYAQEPLDQWET